jgi:hypothetical protein
MAGRAGQRKPAGVIHHSEQGSQRTTLALGGRACASIHGVCR